jgi:pimeloyl-ACP methyl ester carboxylesterase
VLDGEDVIEVVSPDATRLAVERVGNGPPLLAVHGSTADRSRWAPVRDALAEMFTLYLLDRRGRGGSTMESAAPYALKREAEDVAAAVERIGEPVRYLGHSYGALIGIEALTMTAGITRALLYEPPFDTPGHEVFPAALVDRFAALLATEDREGALDLFYREVVGIDPTPLRTLPIWQVRLAAVHTLEREVRIGLDYHIEPARFASLRVPVRLLVGSQSPPAFPAAAGAAAAAIPGAELVELPGHGHGMIDADPHGFVAQVEAFLAD